MIKVLLLIVILVTFTTAVAQSRDTAGSHVEAGLAAQKAGNCKQALREYAAEIQLNQKNFVAQFNSGSCYAALERWEEALAAYKASLSLRPNDAFIHVTLGQVYVSMDRTTEAIDALKQALRLDPKVPFA